MSERKKISFGTDVKEGTRAGSASADQQARHSSNPTTKPASSFPPDTVSQARRARIEAAIGRTIPPFPVRGATPDQLAQAGEISDLLRTEFSFRTPDRGLEGLEDSDVNWREGKKPDYTVADLQYFLGKTKNHEKDSLEETVENIVKTWEMEATHKLFEQWTTVDHGTYTVQANGGKIWTATESSWTGNYNWLLSSCDKSLYDHSEETFESSHGKFRYAFPEGFPWEVLEVLSPPPQVFFSWRHWANFAGNYKGHHGNGQLLTMTGFGLITLNDVMKATNIQIFYNPDPFLKVLKGELPPSALNEIGAAYGEPIAAKAKDKTAFAASTGGEEESGNDDEEEGDGGRGGSGGGGGRGKCPFMHNAKHDMKPLGSASGGRCPFAG
eukprot:CAMPEP_0185804266 /NCGR_PEP_ID=MMETSP1322-20130828/3150_1 /TAXON_ID=265543 /ORGANISM="Minutocellus polymorphus, Strain RCC2270" /LENGTH=382 /DNA_ID=CAMNT_0028500231 /DNA_START=8 /DNA_END=1156 /DNA_ORIENTATION=-